MKPPSGSTSTFKKYESIPQSISKRSSVPEPFPIIIVAKPLILVVTVCSSSKTIEPSSEPFKTVNLKLTSWFETSDPLLVLTTDW